MMEKITSTHELQQVQNMVRAFKTGKLKPLTLCRLAGLKNAYVLKDALRGKSTLSQQDFIAIKKAINFIRNDVKNVLQAMGQKSAVPERVIEDIRKLIQREEVAWFVVMGRNREQRNKFDGWLNSRRSFPAESIDFLKSCLLIFLAETSI